MTAQKTKCQPPTQPAERLLLSSRCPQRCDYSSRYCCSQEEEDYGNCPQSPGARESCSSRAPPVPGLRQRGGLRCCLGCQTQDPNVVPVAWRWDGFVCRLVDLLQMCNAVVYCASIGIGAGEAYDVDAARSAFDVVVVVMMED